MLDRILLTDLRQPLGVQQVDEQQNRRRPFVLLDIRTTGAQRGCGDQRRLTVSPEQGGDARFLLDSFPGPRQQLR